MRNNGYYKFPNFYAIGYWGRRIGLVVLGAAITYSIKCLLVYFGII